MAEISDGVTSLSDHVLDTPSDSPDSCASCFPASSDRPSKRVGFLPHIPNPHIISGQTFPLGHQARRLPPSKQCKATKSILKPSTAAPLSDPPDPLSPFHVRDFARMMDDICRELASNSRGARLDAYQTLNRCLKAYNEVPDIQAMQDKMSLLTDFIRRDLSTEGTDSMVLDHQLTGQVLKLLAICLYSPGLATMLDDDFCSFLACKSIAVVGDQNSSKKAINQYLHLLTIQTIRPKVLTPERASRLLTLLRDVTVRIKGHGVVVLRLMIYRRLLTHSPTLMNARVNDWLDHLFAGMLSNIKEVRAKAIAFGLDASLALGTVMHVSRAVEEIFNRSSPAGRKFVHVITTRLNEMIASKDETSHVPQIWSIMILFFRSHRNQIEQWEHLRVLLGTIQKCFNSSDGQVKVQAHIAWNRLIFAMSLSVATDSSVVGMLRQPFVGQLDRRTRDEKAKNMAYATYCTLLYYAFRPTATLEDLDYFWKEYVTSYLIRTDHTFACQVLISLLGGGHPKVWSLNRANDHGPIKPDELPRLDARWVRARTAPMLSILETLLHSSDWQAETGGEPWALRAWRSFVQALGDASSKEIKVSMDCMKAIALVLTTLQKFWVQCTRSTTATDRPVVPIALHKFTTLVKIAVEKLGTIPFTEKRLMSTARDSFEAAETPSSRLSRHCGTLSSPVYHLVCMLISAQVDVTALDPYRAAVSDLLQIALRTVTSRRSRLKILRDFAYLTTSDTLPAPASKMILWELIIELVTQSVAATRAEDSTGDTPHYAGHDYREAVRIMEIGLQHTSVEMIQDWSITLGKINTLVIAECGVSGSTLSVVEPIAEILSQKIARDSSHGCIQYVAITMGIASWPESQADWDRAQKALWGTAVTTAKSTFLSPFSALYSLTETVLLSTYQFHQSTTSTDIVDLFRALTVWISLCPLSLVGIMIKRIQRGVGVWIADAAGFLNKSDLGSQKMFAVVSKLWNMVADFIEAFSQFDNTLLSALQPLLIASLSSRHQALMNRSVVMWNNTFGLAKGINYSRDLAKVLRRLSSLTDMLLPGNLEDESDMEVELTSIDFIATPQAVENESDLSKGLAEPDMLSSKISHATTGGKLAVESAKPPNTLSGHAPTSTPWGSRPPSTPPRRLRHDDSQIHFAAIDSSPVGSDFVDSQLLTERQKEVNARQHQDALAMFSDLRSSPRPPPQAVSTGMNVGRGADNVLQTPVVADRANPPMMDEAADDCPIEKPVKTATGPISLHRERRVDEALLFGNDASIEAPTDVANMVESSFSASGVKPMQHQHSPAPTMPSVAKSDRFVSKGAEECIPTPMKIVVDAQASPGKPGQTAVENAKATQDDKADFSGPNLEGPNEPVTALSTSILLSDASPVDTDLVMGGNPPSNETGTTRAGVFGGEDDSPMGERDADDPVAAQIAMDMERALSQTDETQDTSPWKGENMDDREDIDSVATTRKTTPRRPLQAVQVVIEKRFPPVDDEEMLDCIVVASAPLVTGAVSPPFVPAEPVSASSKGSRRTSPRFIPQKRPSIAAESLSSIDGGKMSRKKRKVRGEDGLVHDGGSSGTPSPSISVRSRRSRAVHARTARSPMVADPEILTGLLPSVSPSLPPDIGERNSDGASPVAARGCDSAADDAVNRGLTDELGPDRTADDASLLTVSKPLMPQQTDPDVAAVPGTTTNSSVSMVPKAATTSDSPIPNVTVTKGPFSRLEPGRVTGGDVATAAGMLAQLKGMVQQARDLALEPGAGRELISTWLALGQELYEAERRGASEGRGNDG